MSTITSIDLGSNSFRVLVYNYEKNLIEKEYHEIVGTADGLVDTGLISNSAIQRIIQAIKKSSHKLQYDPANCVAVTTAAMRTANNTKYALNEIHKHTGLKLNIIDANEEARLTHMAIQFALKREKLESKKFVLLDIGGGSTELIVSLDDTYFVKSFDFGIVTLQQEHKDTHILKNDLLSKKNQISEYLQSLNIDLKEFEFIATAGTPTTIAAVKHGLIFELYDKNVVNGTKVNLEDLNNCMNILDNSTVEEYEKIFGTNSKEFIQVGILIFKTIFEVLNKNESIVFDDGLREGVAINYAVSKGMLNQ